MLALCPGGECCYRIFAMIYLLYWPDPRAHCHCNTRANPNCTAGSIRRAYVCDMFWLLTRESVVRHPTLLDVSPHLKPERRYPPAAGLQCSDAVPLVVSQVGSRSLERRGFCYLMFSHGTYYDLLCCCLLYKSTVLVRQVYRFR